MHFGLISGAYRQYASATEGERRAVDATTQIGLFIIVAASLLVFLPAVVYSGSNGFWMQTLLSISIGLACLVSAWANNKLIAQGRLYLSAATMILGTTLSLVIVVLTEDILLTIASLAIHPILTILVAPRARIFDMSKDFPHIGAQLIVMCKLGLGVYLATALTIAGLHVDRFLVAVNLGESMLGEYAFPIFILTTTSVLITALNNFYYPKIMSVADQGDGREALNYVLKKYQNVLYFFGAMACIAILTAFYAINATGYYLEEKYRITLYIIPAILVFFSYERYSMEMLAKKQQYGLLIFPALVLLIFMVLVTFSVALIDLSISGILAFKVVAIFLAYIIFRLVRGRSGT